MRKGPPAWEPSEAEFARYKARDFELALSNVTTALASGGSSHDTLHARPTVHEAMQAILASRHNRFARDPRRFGALPRERKHAA